MGLAVGNHVATFQGLKLVHTIIGLYILPPGDTYHASSRFQRVGVSLSDCVGRQRHQQRQIFLPFTTLRGETFRSESSHFRTVVTYVSYSSPPNPTFL